MADVAEPSPATTEMGDSKHSPPNNNNHANSVGSEDKGHTFRKRRLSLTNLREHDKDNNGRGEAGASEEPQSKANATIDSSSAPPAEDPNDNPFDFNPEAFAASQQPPVEEEKAHSFRKRRLSLTQNREHGQEDDDTSGEHAREPPNSRRRRRDSEASYTSMDSSNQPRLKSRTVHAAELLAHPPPSPSMSRLYQQKSAPPQRQPSLLDTISGDSSPKWKKRHTKHIHEDDNKLPFPRDIVGTFSCHGVEPIYEDEYTGEEDEDWVLSTHGGSDADRPTTAAKINQDRGGVAFPYGNCPRSALFAVYDGHGQGGELVAQFSLHEVQRRLEKHAEFVKDIAAAFKDTFLGVDQSLKDEVLIEPLYAGTTACVALLRENQLVLANAGDSRAVLARKTPNNDHIAIDLTKDQNPDLPEEQSRIESMGGFVSPPPEPGLSARVWLDEDCTQIGLAMARSLGDHAVKEVGVIAEPVVTFHDIEPDDDFVIFATDGVWEFVSSDEAVKIVAENLDRGATRACQALIEAAAAKWHDEEGDYRDDITALVVRLPLLWKTDHAKQQKFLQAKKNSKADLTSS